MKLDITGNLHRVAIGIGIRRFHFGASVCRNRRFSIFFAYVWRQQRLRGNTTDRNNERTADNSHNDNATTTINNGGGETQNDETENEMWLNPPLCSCITSNPGLILSSPFMFFMPPWSHMWYNYNPEDVFFDSIWWPFSHIYAFPLMMWNMMYAGYRRFYPRSPLPLEEPQQQHCHRDSTCDKQHENGTSVTTNTTGFTCFLGRDLAYIGFNT